MTSQLTTLPNGFRIATRAMSGIETAAVALHTDAGARHEAPARNGLAHLFEHMVFKGAGDRDARGIAEAIEDVGGALNASTGREGTAFSARVMAEHLPLGVDLLADFVTAPLFRADELEREKQVVLQELGEARDAPDDIIFDQLAELCFPDQGLGRPVLGEEETIAAVTVEDLRFWAAERYRAGSTMLVAAGKVDHEALVSQAERRFGALPAGAIAPDAPARFVGGRRVDRRRAEQAHIALAFPAPGLLDPRHHAARLFAELAGGGMSSRLFQAVREERGLAYSVWASLHGYRDAGALTVYLAAKRDEAAGALQLTEAVLAAAAAEATEAELARAKRTSRAGLLMALESPQGWVDHLAHHLSLSGELAEPARTLERVEAVTLDEVRAVAGAILAGPRATASIGGRLARAA